MVTKQEHEALMKRVEALEKKLEELLTQNKEKDDVIKDLEGRMKNNEQQTTTADFWSQLPKQATMAITQVVTKEKTMIKKKENNIIITGMTAQTPNEQSNEAEEAVNKLFISLVGKDDEIEQKNFKVTRFKSKIVTKPGPILVEFKDINDKKKILQLTKQLKDNEDYKNVYINKDLTESELAVEKRLRVDRRKKNAELTETNEIGFKYGWHKFGNDIEESRFYWGVRNGDLKKIKCKATTNEKT